MNKQDKAADFFRNKCKGGNLKVTPQRTAIYQELIGDYSHPSADDVYRRIRKKFPNISFDTVNRTLLSFVDIGIVKVVENYTRQKRFDSVVESHHHLCCIKCNTIIDFHSKVYDDLKIPSSIKNKYKVIGKRVVLEAVCDKCSRKEKRT